MRVEPAIKTTVRILRQAGQVDRTKVQPGFAIRCTVGIAIPLVASSIAGYPAMGIAAATGALCAGFASQQGTYRTRAAGMVVTVVGMAISTLVGATLGKTALAAALLIGLWGFGSGILASLGPMATVIGQYAVLSLIIVGAFELTPVEAVEQSLLLLGGGLVQTVLLVAVWPMRRFSAERHSLAAAYRGLAAYARRLPRALLAEPDSQPLSVVQGALADPQPFARRGEIATFEGLFTEAERIRARLAALSAETHVLDERGEGRDADAIVAVSNDAARLLEELADALDSGNAPTELPDAWKRLEDHAAVIDDGSFPPDQPVVTLHDRALEDIRALLGQLRAAFRMANATDAPGGISNAVELRRVRFFSVREAMITLRANLSRQSAYFQHALRLGVVLAVASYAAHAVLLAHHGYWAPLTALFVLRPDFSTTVTRGVNRLVGTIIGAGIATLLAALLRPSADILVLLVIVFSLLGYLLINVNYALYSITVTMYVVFILALAGLPEQTAIVDRVVATIFGGLLALAAYTLTPTWERGRVAGELASMIASQREYAIAVLSAYTKPQQSDERALSATQASSWRARTNAEASVDRLVNDPVRPGAITVRTALGLLAASRQLGIVLLALRTQLDPAMQPVLALQPLIDQLNESMLEIVESLRERRAPRKVVPLRDTQLAFAESIGRTSPNSNTIVAETDLIVDSVNTMTELVTKRFGSAEGGVA